MPRPNLRRSVTDLPGFKRSRGVDRICQAHRPSIHRQPGDHSLCRILGIAYVKADHEKLRNKTVLITGGNSGIGKATVLAFAKEGANVVISGRRVAEGEKLAKEITSGGGSALFVRTGVAQEDDIVALVQKSVGTFGALHIAFNNAGTEGQFGLLTTEQTVEHYHQVCDINIRRTE